MRNKGSGGIFSYDSLDKQNPEDRPIIVRQDWRYIGIVLAFVLAIVVIIALLLFVGYVFAMSFDTNMMRLGWTILIVVFGAIGIVVISAALSAGKWLTTWADMKGLFNRMQYQSHIREMNESKDAFYDVMGRRMDRSQFEGVKNLTYGHTISVHKNSSAQISEEYTEDIEDDFIMPTLEELRRENMIARSGNSLLLGFSDEE